MTAVYKKIDNIIDNILKSICLFCMICLFIILIFNVFFRMVPLLSNIPNFSMGWFGEIIELLFAWLVMTAASYLCKHKDHFRVDIIQMKLAGKLGLYVLDAAVNIITLFFYVGLLIYGWDLAAAAVQTTPVLMMQKRWMYLCIPVNSLLMVFFTVLQLCENIISAVRFKHSGNGR